MSGPPPQPPRPGSHVPALDGVRGLAILPVMLYHFAMFGGVEKTGGLLDRAFYEGARAGWIGVDLFFVLSGFLITGILLDTRGEAGYFRTFYARRALRIFPLYYGALALFLLVLPALLPLNQELRPPAGSHLPSWTYLLNVLIARDGWDSVSLYVAHFWSLAIEEQFYLFWPLLVFFLSRRGLVRVCCGILVLGCTLRLGLHLAGERTAAYLLTPARMDTLAVGALLAVQARAPGGLARLTPWAGPAACASLLLLAATAAARGGLSNYDPFVQTAGYTLLAILFGAVLVLSATAPPASLIGRLATLPPLRSLGVYSYALYVFHQPVILLLRDHGITVETFPRPLGLQFPGQLLLAATAGALSLGVALLSWHLYEKHFLGLKAWFPYRPASPPPLPAERGASLPSLEPAGVPPGA